MSLRFCAPAICIPAIWAAAHYSIYKGFWSVARLHSTVKSLDYCLFVRDEMRSSILGVGASSHRKEVRVVLASFHSPPFGQTAAVRYDDRSVADFNPGDSQVDGPALKEKEKEIKRR